MRRLLRGAVLLCASLAVTAVTPVTPALAADWGLIHPGTSTMESVRGRYGPPTKVERAKEQGHDIEDWSYEGAHAPTGMIRLVVHFGILDGTTFKRDTVRGFRLEPKKGSFNRKLIIDGWGAPDRETQQDTQRIMLFRDGLLVYLDEENHARLMLFTVPQPPAEPSPARR